MNENDAKKLAIKLTNAAYEAGLWKDHTNKTMTPHWQEKAMKIREEIVRHLTRESSGQHKLEPVHVCNECGLEHHSHMAAARCCR